MCEHQQGFILTRKQLELRGKTYLEFWLSTNKGPVKLVTEAQRLVLFVAQQDEKTVNALLRRNNLNANSNVTYLTLKTFSHFPVCGVYFQSSFDFYRARDIFRVAGISCYENDIRVSDRYLMERFIYGAAAFVGVTQSQQQGDLKPLTVITDAKLKPCEYSPDLTLLSIDIECSMQGELFSIGLSSGVFKQVIMIGDPQDAEEWIVWVNNERQLLQHFVKQVQSFNPDIIIGWNLINFDFKVLVERAKLNNVKLNLGRDNSELEFRDARGDSNQCFVRLAGRVVVDGIDSLKTATYQFESFTLQHVAQELLGMSKDTEDVDNRVETIAQDFQHNKPKLARYNLQDCVLVEQIFSHTKVMDYLILRSQITGLELDRMGGSVAAFINLYLPKLHRAGYVSPNRPANGGLASPGGYVMDSAPGLYKHVLVLDFKSLYPSIIRTFKIDPMGLVEGLRDPDDAIPGFKGALFSRNKHFLPDIISSLWDQRDEAKKNNDQARSQAIKILMNSFYGVLGSGGCPFYDTRLASSITLRGHDIMQTTAMWIQQHGYKVIYGDTDSTFVWLENVENAAQAREIGEKLESEINSKWRQKLASELSLECFLEIEFETHFETFLMPTIRGSELGSKKRYAGVKALANGQTELVFKGLETVRSDWTKLAKSFQPKLYKMVFEGADVNQFLRDTVAEIRAGKVDQELVYRKRLRQKLEMYTKNVPPHVKAARIADKRNEELGKPLQYQRKGWISYVITLDGPQPIDYISSPIDHEHYVDKQIRPIAEGILPFVGLSFEQITSDQMGLF
ncbi:DNA polymerase II [Aliiglaciecola sp. M165]|uniref:DNA polymerase II n=1 Tax=Aliiglaciecola sp. M165 TaxID=2593649 RepID=UPI00118167B3|nr:DNA polymerase II [Aliiglaciecola sp. M165]TRY31718.1 DNA polymerase II [Aliiglaciecola sp. M165]